MLSDRSFTPRKVRWLFAIPIVLIVGLLADYYVLHILFPIKKKALIVATLEAMTPDEKAALQNTKDRKQFTSNSPESADKNLEIERSFQKALEECAPEIRSQGVGTPDGLIQFLKNTIGVQSEDFQLENYNFIISDGTERRIHLIPKDNSQSKKNRELRFYRLDSEGYPERINLPNNQELNPTQESINKMMMNSEVYLHEIKSTFNLKDGSKIWVDLINNKAYQLQYFVDNRSLNCDSTKCQCNK